MAIKPIRPLFSESATATNGSDTIAVTGNVDCSYIYDGFLVALGTRQVVEAVSGTAPDGSGNSTITLRRPWAPANTTAPLLGWNSIEGLPAAVNRLRELIGQSSEINDELLQLAELATTGVVRRTGQGEYDTIANGATGRSLLAATSAGGARSTLQVLQAGTADGQARTNLQNDGRFEFKGVAESVAESITETALEEYKDGQALLEGINTKATLIADFVRNQHRVYEQYGLTDKAITGVLDTTRASTATYDSPFGVATAAVDEPRITYDPETGACLGLLSEESRTNLALWGEDWLQGSFGNGWSQSGGFFRQSVAGDLPIRNTGFEVCYFGPNNGVDSFSNAINHQVIGSLGASGTYVVRAYYKAVGDTTTVRFLHTPQDGGSGTAGGVLRLTGDGGVQTSNFSEGDTFGSQTQLSCEPVGNGWYEVICVFTTIRTVGSIRVRAFPYIGTSSLTGDGVSGLQGTMLTFEAGSFPTSYIPTGASAVTRAGEVTLHQLSNPPTDELSILCDVTPIGRAIGLNNVVRLFSIANTEDQAQEMLSVEIDLSNRLRTRSVVVPNLLWDADFPLDNSPLKIMLVLSKSKGFVRIFLNGRLVDQNNSINITYDISNWQFLRLWHTDSDSGATITRKLQYFPIALPNSEAIAQTGGN